MQVKEHVEVLGLEGLSVTQCAKKMAQQAGYQVRVTVIHRSDLPGIRAALGITRLPAARSSEFTVQGMRAIRSFFSGSSRAY